MKKEPVYLGDGVYVQEDEAGNIVLTTSSHNIIDADNVIYLEPFQVQALYTYVGK